jgi:glutathione S-transferase
MLKILGRVTSINVRKVLWLADELGLSYEREDWGLPLRDPKVPEFLALNPNAQVPVLIDGDFVLWESTAILRYLAAAHGPTDLLPDDPRERARVDQWIGWQGSDLSGVWGYAVMALVRRIEGYDDETKIAESLARWTAKMKILDAALEGRDFIAAGRFTLADICLALAAHRWFAVERDLPSLPNVRTHYDRMRARPAGAPYLGPKTP